MPNIIITHAKAYTLNPQQPWAEAMVIEGNKIAYVGNNVGALGYKTSQSRLIDAKGRSLLPGLIDSHFHLYMGSLRLEDMQLSPVRKLTDLARVIQDYKESFPNKLWLRGQRLAYDITPGRRLNRFDLDAIESDRPLALASVDFHTLWCNTRALEMANILRGQKVKDGEIVMGADGLASGELREYGAMNLIYKLIPPLNQEEKLSLICQGIQEVVSYGITSLHCMHGNMQHLSSFRELEARGDFKLRAYLPYDVSPDTPLEALEQEALALKQTYHSDKIRAGMIKVFVDGVLESFTSLMVEPYANKDSLGEALFSDAHFKEVAVEADRLGLQIAVHAIGDGAVKRTLDGFAAARLQKWP
ncbi:MAG: amidohydrolase family protein [Deinococcales bacterium]